MKERILLTGGTGFLGQYIYKKLLDKHYDVFIARHAEFNLVDKYDVQKAIAKTDPNIVIHLAAKIGGIGANMRNSGKFFYDNLMMGTHLLHESYLYGVKKFVGVATICSYPKFCPVPFKEENLWDGRAEETNWPYGFAKKAMTVQSEAYREQYGFNSIVLYPVNLYGPKDNFDLENGHVVPSLLRKFYEAKINRKKEVILWSDGSPTREFLYVDDCAEAIVLATEKYNSSEPVNIGIGQEISIKNLAEKIAYITGYTGEIKWDASKPNGQPRRCLDVSKAKKEFGFSASMDLDTGLQKTYQWMLANYEKIL